MEKKLKNIEDLDTNIDFEAKTSQIEFNSLGKFEKQYIEQIAKALNILKESDYLDLESFKKTIKKIAENQISAEKQYLYGLFFPDSIANIYYFSQIPFQGTIYKQSNKFNITPSQNGYFLLQVKTPIMTNSSSNYSDTYLCNNNKIGIITDESQYAQEPSPTSGAADFQSIKQTSIPTELFSSFITLATTVKVSYIGNLRDQAGSFSASYMASNVEAKLPDKSGINYDYVTRGLNFVECPTLDPIQATFFPLDNSFLEFKPPLDQQLFTDQKTMHVINIWGRGLPNLNASVYVEINRAYACIPNPKYNSAFTKANSIRIDYNKITKLMNDKNVSIVSGENRIKRLENIEKYPKDFDQLHNNFHEELEKISEINLIKLK